LIPLSYFKGKKIVLLTHAGADVDALCSAAALSLFLSRKNNVRVGIPEHISMEAKNIAKRLGVNYSISPKLGKADVLILLDFNSWDMLGEMASAVKAFKGKTFLLDHHAKSRQSIAPSKNTWVEPNAVATCILIYKWLKKSKADFTPKMATLIAAGITTDSAHFFTADSETFLVMSEMLAKAGKKFSEINFLLHVPRDFSEKIAILKAAKRSRIFRLGDFILVMAEVGAFEADAATALVKLGADASFAGKSEQELKISGRAGRAIQAAGLNLAKDVFQQLPSHFPGSGGGHKGAAAFNGRPANSQKALLKCIELARKAVAKKKPGLQFKEYT